jgi:hypothetical protein
MGLTSAPFGGLPAAQVVHQNVTHHFRSESVELPAVPKGKALVAGHPQPCFVHQCGRLQQRLRPLPAEGGTAEPAQFAVHQRDQLVPRSIVAGAPPLEKFGDIGLHGASSKNSLILTYQPVTTDLPGSHRTGSAASQGRMRLARHRIRSPVC